MVAKKGGWWTEGGGRRMGTVDRDVWKGNRGRGAREKVEGGRWKVEGEREGVQRRESVN